jgi:signal peptide peptidase SppA
MNKTMGDLLNSQVWAVSLPVLRAIRAGTMVANAEYWAARGQASTQADVTVIPVMGLLTQRGGWFGMSLERVRTVFRNALADGSKAIVLEFDSPGGEVYGVDELATEFRQGRSVKPIVAVANSLTASAAYYLASQAEEVFVTPSGEIGSIGVYGAHEDWSKALDQFGVTVTLISAGEGKTDGNMFEPLSDEARADMQSAVDRYYGQFTSAVSKGRKVGVDTVRADWKARVYGAKDAVAIGMADAVGTLEDAIRRAASLGQARRATAAALDVSVESRMRARSR